MVKAPVVMVTVIVARVSTSTKEADQAGEEGEVAVADKTSIEQDSGTNPLTGQDKEGVGGAETVTGDTRTETLVGTLEEDSETKLVFFNMYSIHTRKFPSCKVNGLLMSESIGL